MEKISEHITYEQATKSQTAVRHGIKNDPNPDELKAMRIWAEKIYEPVVKACPGVFLSSFFRSRALNGAIGGALNSQHCKGEAGDMDSNGMNSKIFYFIKNNLVFDQLIWEFGNTNEPDWVHASYSEKGNRKQVLRAVRENGKVRYIPFDL